MRTIAYLYKRINLKKVAYYCVFILHFFAYLFEIIKKEALRTCYKFAKFKPLIEFILLKKLNNIAQVYFKALIY